VSAGSHRSSLRPLSGRPSPADQCRMSAVRLQPRRVDVARLRPRHRPVSVQGQRPPTSLPSGVQGGGDAGGGDGVPSLFDRGDASPTPPLFGTEIRANVSQLLQLVTYSNAVLVYVTVNLCLSLVSGVPHFFFRTTRLVTVMPNSHLGGSLAEWLAC